MDSVFSCHIVSVDSVVENLVHLLKSLSVSLWDEEKCPEKRQQAENCEEDVGSITSVLNQWRSN